MANLSFADIYPSFENQLTSIFYHVVSEAPLPYVKHLFLHRNVDGFRSDLEFFASRFNFVTYSEVVAHKNGNYALPPFPLFLSFDDGFRECHQIVAPQLLELGIPATFFLTTSAIDNFEMIPAHVKSLCIERILALTSRVSRNVASELNINVTDVGLNDKDALLIYVRGIRDYYKDKELLVKLSELLELQIDTFLTINQPYLTSDQVRGILDDGFNIGSHAVHHVKLQDIPNTNRESEVHRSVETIRSGFGIDRMGFAFPNNSAGISHHWIESVLNECPSVELVFDTVRRPSGNLVVNRISFDEPLEVEKSWSASTAASLISAGISKTYSG